METHELKQLLDDGFPDAQIAVQGDGRHFELVIVSDVFSGKNRIQRQQLVYQVLGERIASGEIHAVNMKTYTIEEKGTE